MDARPSLAMTIRAMLSGYWQWPSDWFRQALPGDQTRGQRPISGTTPSACSACICA